MQLDFEIHICGKFEVVHRAEPPIRIERLRTRKTESILALLALKRGQWVSRETLLDQFWPEEAPSESRTKLRLVFHSIRQAVGECLESDRDLVRVENVWVDALDQDPLILYEKPLLAGANEEWAIPFQIALDLRIEEATVQALKATEDPKAKIEYLLRLTQLSPLDSRYFVRLFDIFQATGNHAAAMATCRDAQSTLGPDCPSILQQASPAQANVNPSLKRLAYELLSANEPVGLALIGPPGIGKTFTAKQLIPLAASEEIAATFVSLVGVSTQSELETRILSALSQLHQLPVEMLRLSDLPSTLLIVDNAEDLEANGFVWLSKLLTGGSSLRLLLTTQTVTPLGLTNIALTAKSLPISDSVADIKASETGKLFLQESQIEVDEVNRVAIYQICLATGGLPLAIKIVAREYQFGFDDQPGESPRFRFHAEKTLADRLAKSYERLPESLRQSLQKLLFFEPAFHTKLAEAIGIDLGIIRELTGRSWIQSTGERGVMEILPAIRDFLSQKPTPEFDCRTVLASRGRELMEKNYLQIPEEFLPSLDTIKRLFLKSLREGKIEESVSLYIALYFCFQRVGDMAQPLEFGRKLFGEEFSSLWKEHEHGLNLFASAAYFNQNFALAKQLYDSVAKSETPRLAGIGKSNLGLIAFQEGQYDNAIVFLREAAEENGLKDRQLVTRLNNLAEVLGAKGETRAAIETAEQAIAICGEEENLAALRFLLYITLGAIHIFDGDYEGCSNWATRAIRNLDQQGERLRWNEAMLMLANALARQGKESHAVSLIENKWLAKRPMFSAPHWAPGASALLIALSRSDEAHEIGGDLPTQGQPSWVKHLLKENDFEPVQTRVPLTNAERLLIFRSSLKR